MKKEKEFRNSQSPAISTSYFYTPKVAYKGNGIKWYQDTYKKKN